MRAATLIREQGYGGQRLRLRRATSTMWWWKATAHHQPSENIRIVQTDNHI